MSAQWMIGIPKKLMTADEFWDFVHLPKYANRDFEFIRGQVSRVRL
jgi:hypothetical protein